MSVPSSAAQTVKIKRMYVASSSLFGITVCGGKRRMRTKPIFRQGKEELDKAKRRKVPKF